MIFIVEKATTEKILELVLSIGNALEVGEMLGEVTEKAVRLTGADSVTAWLKTGAGEKCYQLVACAGEVKKNIMTGILTLDAIDNLEEATLISENHPLFKQYQDLYPAKSIILLPVNKRGLICLASREIFDQGWCKMLSGIIPRLSRAVELCLLHGKAVEKIAGALSEAESRYREVLDNIPDPIYTIDEKGRFIYVNKTWLDIFGYGLEEVLGRHFSILVHPDDMQANLEFFKQMKSVCDLEARLLTKAGQVLYTETHARTTLDEQGRILRTDGVIRDITWRRQLEEELIRRHQELTELHEQVKILSILDTLTGLYNRHYLNEQLKKLSDPQCQPVSVIMMDVDGLKVVNDTLGHAHRETNC